MASPPRTQSSPQRTHSLSPTKHLRNTQPSLSPAPQTEPQRTRSLSPNKPIQNVQPSPPPAPQAAKRFRFPQASSQPAYLPYPADMFEEIRTNIWASELAHATSTARGATTAASRNLDAVDPPPIPTPPIDIDDFSDSDVNESELSYSNISTTSLTSLCERRDSPPGNEALWAPRDIPFQEDAFDVFQSTGTSKFLMAASLEELRDFIGRHRPSTLPPVFIVSGHSVVVCDL
ncbi:hypothetical protein B0H14DRAFT_3478240 [Mycena olivaceomarginata]|nr:hypothetical protein B0H14DRAFT_3478240 [Mycena olivaceomarginata]